ncbi:adenylyl-sulfate kinase [Foetidibacter luteolus]|uniref:adenylyl-sulfate kinase n=1 Tax=Foetidibacter luteolus TaxID=2608880 RepID=UPI0027B88A91|nr:adenylyl-sulfate kinase [Foetidibacter luteolus]
MIQPVKAVDTPTMSQNAHTTEHAYGICRFDRMYKYGHKPACLWFTGLSGSGKSTLANLVEWKLFTTGFFTYSLDGDNIRKGLNKDLDFTEHSRQENMRRMGEVAKIMCDAGLIVLAAFVSPLKQHRQMLRDIIGENFIEIFVDTPLEICEQRDIKGLYQKARRGEISNFTGISSPFEKPEHPEIHIETQNEHIEQSVCRILDYISPRLKIN